MDREVHAAFISTLTHIIESDSYQVIQTRKPLKRSTLKSKQSFYCAQGSGVALVKVMTVGPTDIAAEIRMRADKAEAIQSLRHTYTGLML